MAHQIDIYLKSIVRRWKKECSTAERITIISPYITSSTAEIVTENIQEDCCEIYTLFNALVFINLSSSVKTLINLKKSGFTIYSLPNLHSKIILTSNDIVTIGSQNLTNKGHRNIESTIITSDPAIIEKVHQKIYEFSKIRTELSLEMLEDMYELIKPFIKKYKKIKKDSEIIIENIQENERKRKIDKEQEIKRKRNRQLQKLEQEKIDKYKKIASDIRNSRPWLVRVETIPEELAKNFIRNTAWWHSHSSGSPVRAPAHAKRMYNSRHGWALDFGANTFLVGKAIERCNREVNLYIDRFNTSQKISLPELKSKLELHIRGAVANHDGYEYEGYYPLTNQDMMFGVQSIDVKDGVNFIIQNSGVLQLQKEA